MAARLRLPGLRGGRRTISVKPDKADVPKLWAPKHRDRRNDLR